MPYSEGPPVYDLQVCLALLLLAEVDLVVVQFFDIQVEKRLFLVLFRTLASHLLTCWNRRLTSEDSLAMAWNRRRCMRGLLDHARTRTRRHCGFGWQTDKLAHSVLRWCPLRESTLEMIEADESFYHICGSYRLSILDAC